MIDLLPALLVFVFKLQQLLGRVLLLQSLLLEEFALLQSFLVAVSNRVAVMSRCDDGQVQTLKADATFGSFAFDFLPFLNSNTRLSALKNFKKCVYRSTSEVQTGQAERQRLHL